jgi:hypothetical protein
MMTPQEHKLMMTMFARQSQMLEILVTVMKREGILERDDIAAFTNVVTSDVSLNDEILQSVADEYKKAAKFFRVNLTGE